MHIAQMHYNPPLKVNNSGIDKFNRETKSVNSLNTT